MTTSNSFDDFFTPISEESDDFFTPIKEPSRAKSLAGAFPKGAVKRAADIAEFFQQVPLPKGEFNPKKAREFAEEKFPTLEKGPEQFLERAGGVATEAALSPGGLLSKAIQIPAGAALGFAAEKLGLPSWAQSIAEGLPFFYSGTKKIPLKPSQKNLGEFLRKHGLNENEITPLLKTPEQINRWSVFASKGKKSRELLESVYHKSGKIYDSIISEAKNLPPLSDESKFKILSEMKTIYDDMPHKYRSLIKEDINDFLTKGRTGTEDIINLDRDINAVIGAEKGGKAIIGRFKGPLENAIESIDPRIAEDYRLAKDLYKTRAKVKGSLVNPKDFDKFLDLGEAYGLVHGITNRDFGMISKVIGAAGGRSLAREMLINPRLQNISVRMGESLKKNKLNLAIKYLKEFNHEIQKDDSDLFNQIDELMPK